jgi:hypothetical protein
MVLDGRFSAARKWKALGGKLWLGDVGKIGAVKIQDVKITGIPIENARAAIRMCQIKPKRILTDAQRAAAIAALEKAHRVVQSPPANATSERRIH